VSTEVERPKVSEVEGPETSTGVLEQGSFMATDPGSGWVVDGGSLDVFVTQTLDGVPVGRWTPLTTIETGSALVGAPATARGFVLLCRLAPGCRVRQVSLETVQGEVEESADRRAEVAARIEAWVGKLLEAVHYRLAPRDFVPISRGERLRLDADSVVRPLDGVAWVTLESGSARLLGRERSRGLIEGVPSPISPAEWIAVDERSTLVSQTTAEVLDDGRVWEPLTALTREAVVLTTLRIARQEEAEAARMATREERDREVVAETNRMFRAILQGRVREGFKVGEEPAFAAAARVGDKLGIEIRHPAKSARSGPRVDPINAIAHASHVRTRTVRLAGQWWKRDYGPLIGYLKPSDIPVALIRRGRSYDLYDPETPEQPVRVNAETAKRLRFDGKVFYRPLPDRPISGWELFKHGMRGGRRDVFTMFLAGAAAAGLGLLVPIMTGVILGTLVAQAQTRRITELCLLLIASAVVSGLMAMFYNIASLRIEGRLDENVQAGIWDRLMSLPPKFYRGSSTGQLATAALAISNVREQLSGLAAKGLMAALVGIANLILIIFLNIDLALLTIGLVIFEVALSLWVGTRQLGRQRKNFEFMKEINSRTFQMIEGVSKLRGSASEDRGFAYWADAYAKGREQSVAIRSSQNRLTAFNAAFTVIGMLVAFFLVGEVLTPGLPTSTFLTFNVAFFQVLGSILVVSTTMMLGVTVAPLLEGVGPIIAAEPENAEDREDPGELSGALEVSHVSFRYDEDGPEILHDVSFAVKPGQFVGVVGPSGSGKSTLLRLLLGFETPDSGAVLYDEQDLANLDVISVRRQTGVVLQNGSLFQGDILTNIVGSGIYTYEEAWDAIVACGMEDDIDQMPMGLHTVLSEGASTLSGGQRQRLLIARAIVAKPRIMFLDEATSALDNRTQEIVTESLRRLNATRVVIAHRLTTIRDADHIIVMEAGRIVQTGTFEELMAQEGLFRALARRQLL
jgi:NHLM bacteriocin system ABC transporter ATP-binding protein